MRKKTRTESTGLLSKPTVLAALRRGIWMLLLPWVPMVLSGCEATQLVIVRQTTVVHEDGVITRTVRLERVNTGNTSASEDSTLDRSWVESEAFKAGRNDIRIAYPDSWSRLEKTYDGIVAEDSCTAVGDVRPSLAHSTSVGLLPDRMELDLQHEDLVLLERWKYREIHGDPFDAVNREVALDMLLGLIAEPLYSELRIQFGSDYDFSPAAAFLYREGRPLLREILELLRTNWTQETLPEGAQLDEALSRHGVPLSELAVSSEPDESTHWNLRVNDLLAWMRKEVAAALSVNGHTVREEDLAFWPTTENGEEDLEEREEQLLKIGNRTWPGETEHRADVIVEMYLGHYLGAGGLFDSNPGSPVEFFESRLHLPGVLIRTNGTPDGGDTFWQYSPSDLYQGDMVLEAESILLNKENLRALGVHRELQMAELFRITGILAGDSDGKLAELLTQAVAAKDVKLLEDGWSEARRLAEVLAGE